MDEIKGSTNITTILPGDLTVIPVSPSLPIECPGETLMNPLSCEKCCDINTLSDDGYGNFTRPKFCPSYI